MRDKTEYLILQWLGGNLTMQQLLNAIETENIKSFIVYLIATSVISFVAGLLV
jgi:hypothetical protein